MFTVELDPGLVAFQIGKITEQEVRDQVEVFCEPDARSRTEDEGGRKLVEINPYLYRVVNGAVYDRMQREEERREYNRERQKTIRAVDKEAPVLTGGKNKPTLGEVKLFAAKAGLPAEEAEQFFNHYESNGWKVGRVPMKSLSHTIAKWKWNWQKGIYDKFGRAGRRTLVDQEHERRKHEVDKLPV